VTDGGFRPDGTFVRWPGWPAYDSAALSDALSPRRAPALSSVTPNTAPAAPSAITTCFSSNARARNSRLRRQPAQQPSSSAPPARGPPSTRSPALTVTTSALPDSAASGPDSPIDRFTSNAHDLVIDGNSTGQLRPTTAA